MPFVTRGTAAYGNFLGLTPHALGYNWAIDVDYSLYDREDHVVGKGQFSIPGQHGQEQNPFLTGLAMFIGSTPERLAYPNTAQKLEISQEVIQLAANELVHRLSQADVAAFFQEEEERRGEMSRSAYSGFLLRQKAALARSEAKSEVALVARQEAQLSGVFDLKRSNVVVFGIGVDQYNSDAFPDLAFAASDCNKVVGWFRDRYDLQGDQATCLTNADATAVRINRYLKQNAARLLGPEDTFVFYFSGHGAPDSAVRSADGDGFEKYLLVSNSEPDSLPLTGVNLTRLFDSIDQLPARRKIILIDSCFAGEAGKRVVANLEGESISQTSYQNAIGSSRKGTILIAASTENQVSLEKDTLRSGLFTHHLVEGLAGGADGGDSDDQVDLMELYRHVSAQVSDDTRGSQTPILRGELDSNIEF